MVTSCGPPNCWIVTSPKPSASTLLRRSSRSGVSLKVTRTICPPTKSTPRFKPLTDTSTIDAMIDRRLIVMRSEEHTSELQSLMRISYAVFCLKQKIQEYYSRQQHLLPPINHNQP